MKILVVHPSVELYGADKILLYILGFLSDKNEVTVLLPKNGVLVDYIRHSLPSVSLLVENHIPIVHSKLGIRGFLKLPHLLMRTRLLFARHSFDLIYCNTLATVLFLHFNWAKKKVMHVHEIIENKILKFGFSVLIRMKTKKVICVSRHVKEGLFFSSPYAVVHNGIPDTYLNTKVDSTSVRKLRFVLPGRYMPKKGQWFLIDSLRLISQEKLSHAEFCLYGSPPPAKPELEARLKDVISEASLNEKVSLHGFQQDIAEIYGNADVVLVPSMMADPFPTTVLESMMFAKPVITTNNGGASEIVKNSFGILVSPGDKNSLAKAIEYFVENRDAAFAMGAIARKEYESKLTLERFRENFLSAIHEWEK